MATSVAKPAPAVLLLTLLLALPGPLGAQAGPAPASGDRASPAGGILLKASRIAGKNRIHFGGWAGLVFGGKLAIGGGGYSLLEDVALAGSEGGTGFDLGMGYGGVLVRYWRPVSPRLTGEFGFLMGAGHAVVRVRGGGTELGDNFVVAEPEASLFLDLFPRVRVGAGVGYRLIWGVEDLPGVSEDDLRSATATLSVRLGGS